MKSVTFSAFSSSISTTSFMLRSKMVSLLNAMYVSSVEVARPGVNRFSSLKSSMEKYTKIVVESC